LAPPETAVALSSGKDREGVSPMTPINDVTHDLLRLREIEWAIGLLITEAKQIFNRVSPGDDEKMRAHLAALVLVP